MSSKKEIVMDLHDLLNRKQTGASVSVSKVDNYEEAASRLKANLERQLKYWENREEIYSNNESVARFNSTVEDKKHKRKPKVGTRSLWFKKKELNDFWMLKMNMGTTPVYTSDDAKDNNEPWIEDIAESEMSDAIKMFIKGIESGDKELEKHLRRTYEIYEISKLESTQKSKKTREAKAKAKI
jgi:hypothetical protein